MTSHEVQIILKILFARHFLTFSLIKLEFWFLDLVTSHVVQIILENIFAHHWRYIPPKQRFYRRFYNFVSDYARVLVFRHNDFLSGLNNLRNPIACHWRYIPPNRR